MSFGPNNAQLQTLYSDEPPPPQPPSHHLTSSSSGDPPFNSSIALTILVLFSALFFMGFFSIYIRRFSTDPPPPELTLSNNRRLPRPAVSLKYKGVDPEVIRALPVYSYYRGEEIECCAICLGEFEEKENVRIIPYCRHVFHLECIGTWLKMHVTCPVCRGTQLFGSSGRRCGGGVAAAEVCGIHEGVRRSTVENGDTCIDIGEVRLVRV